VPEFDDDDDDDEESDDESDDESARTTRTSANNKTESDVNIRTVFVHQNELRGKKATQDKKKKGREGSRFRKACGKIDFHFSTFLQINDASWSMCFDCIEQCLVRHALTANQRDALEQRERAELDVECVALKRDQ
jgi:hypothetical protein